ncbi:MAG: phospholipase D family protein [Aquabacterium sp.]
MTRKWWQWCLIIGLCATAQAGCAQLPQPGPRPAVQALSAEAAARTPLGQLSAGMAPEPGISGFRLLVAGQDALDTLLALADNARQTLDLQYYLIHGDDSSRTIMRHVRAAADRGVRVRLLLDDLNTAGQDQGLMALTRHPRIEVRLYNPLPTGRLHIGTRLLASLTDLKRINHRMHNKMFVADNAMAVTGGRNLGDAYFLRDTDSNFLDIDVLAAGPAVQSLSRTFDRFWNDPLAYPVSAVVDEPATPTSAERLPTPASAALMGASAPSSPQGATRPPPWPPQTRAEQPRLDAHKLRLEWVRAHVLADKPSKLRSGGDPAPHEKIDDDIERMLKATQRELLIISPYFVPGEHGMSLLRTLRQRGVDVRVLTNSLATTDAPAVHTGYARYRVPLLQDGVRLFELRPDLGHIPDKRVSIGSMGSSRASLHAKVFVIDQATAVVGSMNLDPRSRNLNSEMGVVMRSPVLARQLKDVFEAVSARSYALSLGPDQRLQWKTLPPDPKLEEAWEPGAGFWLKMGIRLLSPFAPEEML